MSGPFDTTPLASELSTNTARSVPSDAAAAAAVVSAGGQPPLVTTSQPLGPDSTSGTTGLVATDDPFAPGGMFAMPDLENVGAGAALDAGGLDASVSLAGDAERQDSVMSDALAALPLPVLPNAPLESFSSPVETAAAPKTDSTAADAAAEAPILTPVVQAAPAEAQQTQASSTLTFSTSSAPAVTLFEATDKGTAPLSTSGSTAPAESTTEVKSNPTAVSPAVLPPASSMRDSAAPPATSSSGTLSSLPALPSLVAPSLSGLLASPVTASTAPKSSAASIAAAAAQANREREREEALQREREAEEKKEREAQEAALREADEMRLLWLSLPSNDHPTYYSDTSASSEPSSPQLARHPESRSAKGRTTFLPSSSSSSAAAAMRASSSAAQLLTAPLEAGSSTEDLSELDEDLSEEEEKAARRHRTGNRGNKLKRNEGARWVRRGKLGSWTEARGDKEMNDRVRLRIASLQRAGVRSLLTAAPSPHLAPVQDEPEDDLLPPSSPPAHLTSTALAPALLRPVLTPRALLESHTLRHTFRNPHIAALSKTALDLRESEGGLGRALGRCFAELERFDWLPEDDGEPVGDGEEAQAEREENGGDSTMKSPGAPNGQAGSTAPQQQKHRRSVRGPIDADAIGAEGTNLTADELNPSFGRLDELFVTPGGLPIPLGSDPNPQPLDSSTATGEEALLSTTAGTGAPPAQAVLSVTQQRDVVRAALDCLNELGADSREYVERLDEVRARLAAVKRERAIVWDALRSWALARELGQEVLLPNPPAQQQHNAQNAVPRTPLSAQGRNGEEAKRAAASSTSGKNKKTRVS